MSTRQDISVAEARDEVVDVLAEALWAILLQDGQLTTGSCPKPKPANDNEQQAEIKRL